MEIKHANSGEDFRNNAKKYVINMMKNSRQMLHIRNGCYYGKYLEYYVDFDTLAKAKESGIDFIKCKNCFKEEEEC